MSIDEDIDQLKQSLTNDTDISKAILELFKDDGDNLEKHPIDIRTRLIQPEIAAMSLTNYLDSIIIQGTRPRKQLLNKKSGLPINTLGMNLNILMNNLKRHKLSFLGKSREEITRVITAKFDNQQFNHNAPFQSIFQRHD